MTHRARSNVIRWSDRIGFGALVLAVAFWLCAEHPFWRPIVTVRSCGGNFELLHAFARDFERRHDCRVQYVAAPVQFLLELAAEDERHLPEVLVGRSGPGWAFLQRQGRLAAPPTFFAIDPLVIVTPPGNPAAVKGLVDLGRDGVRVLAAPGAMRPKGRVVASLLADVSEARYPGLVDRWERNTVAEMPCGRLLARRLSKGGGDAAVLSRSQTSQPPLAGTCEAIAIPPEELDLMRSGRGSLPQSVARTVRHPANALADRFVAELANGAHGLVEQCGYIPRGHSDYARYEALLRRTSPQPMAERQMALAAALQESGATREAVRRYLHVIHVFGPSRWDAEAWYRLGDILDDAGSPQGARRAWQHLVSRYPTRGHKEWLGILALGDDVGTDPEKPWVKRAAAALAARPQDGTPAALPEWHRDATPMPFAVREGDPPKGARRTLAVATDLLHLGLVDFAARDALKVATLHYPSPHTPAARTVAGTALLEAGRTAAARRQWQRVAAQYPGANGSAAAAAAVAATAVNASPTELPAGDVPMPPTVAAYDTHPERAMSYAGELYEAGLTLYALKEYLKVCVGIYGQPAPLAEARFRAGVCLAAMDRDAAACRQWGLCRAAPGPAAWHEHAARANAVLGAPPAWPDAKQRQRVGIPDTVTTAPAAENAGKTHKGQRSQAVARLHLGEELLLAGVLDEDEALQEFLKVLTVVEVPEHLSWVRAAAHVRAAQALLLSERAVQARHHAEAAARTPGPADLVALATRLLEQCAGRAEVLP